MTSVALALVAAVAWGAGDFLGGRPSKLVSSTVVVWTSGVMSIVMIGAGALVLGGADQRGTALAWGFAGGVAVGLGGLVLYKGLAEGRMSVVAPTAGVVGAALPVAVDVVRGERLGATIWLGIALALAAIRLHNTQGMRVPAGS